MSWNSQSPNFISKSTIPSLLDSADLRNLPAKKRHVFFINHLRCQAWEMSWVVTRATLGPWWWNFWASLSKTVILVPSSRELMLKAGSGGVVVSIDWFMVVGCWWFKRFCFFGCERFESRNELIAKVEGNLEFVYGLFVKNSGGECRYLYSRSYFFCLWGLALFGSVNFHIRKTSTNGFGPLLPCNRRWSDLRFGGGFQWGGDGWSRPLLCFRWCEMGWDDFFDLMMIATGIGTFWPCLFCSNMGNIHSPVKWLRGTTSHWNTFLNSGIWFFKSSARDLSGQLEIKLSIALPTWALPRSSVAARSSRRSRVISCDICATRPRIPMVLDEFGQQARLRMHFARSERLKVGGCTWKFGIPNGSFGYMKAMCKSNRWKRVGKRVFWPSSLGDFMQSWLLRWSKRPSIECCSP